KADRAAAVCFNDRRHNTLVDRVKPESVDFQHFECMVCRPERYGGLLFDDGEVPYSPEQAVGDTRRPPRTFCQFQCTVRIDCHFENLRGAVDDCNKTVHIIRSEEHTSELLS